MSELVAESSLTAAVWHRPLVDEVSRDRLAKRQANAAVALLRLGREAKVWPLLRHRPDPRTRSYLVHRFGPLDADWKQVVRKLDHEREVSTRRALILSLGEFSAQQMPPGERERLVKRLLALYAHDPDPGIHGAAAWTLHKWGRQAETRKVDHELATGTPLGGRRWYVNGQGQTLVIVPSPGEVMIGSPPWEVGRDSGTEERTAVQYLVRIEHSFTIAAHPVTVAEFLRFRKDFAYRRFFSPEPACPMGSVSWYDAVAYCNWLSEREGIAREEWCYLPNERGEYAQGMIVVADCLRRSGYRLPTEAEWEFACRAGALTSRYYGQNADLDKYYTCSMQNSLGRRMAAVGTFKPNDMGLFDTLGNIAEWCDTAFHDGSRPLEHCRGEGAVRGELLSDRRIQSVKGSAFMQHAETMRSGWFLGLVPNARVYSVGFRLSRTYCREGSGVDAGRVVTQEDRLAVRGDNRFSPEALARGGCTSGG